MASTSASPVRLARRHRRLRRKIKRHIENTADIPVMIARYNQRFDDGHFYPFGIGAFLLGGDPCAYCGDTDARTWDHIEAEARGGEARADNLVRSCARCNKSKFSTPLLLYLVQRAHRRRRTGKTQHR